MKKWLERAIETTKFHKAHCVLDDDWTINKTAERLRRSLGSICEDILIGNAYKSHKESIEKFEYAKNALEFIRKKKKQNFLELDV